MLKVMWEMALVCLFAYMFCGLVFASPPLPAYPLDGHLTDVASDKMVLGEVGAGEGGQLTRPMFSNPRRLVLFDEIEKAYPRVFDLMLSLMGEGRLTEQGSGKVADFTQAVIVLTSNAEHESIGRLREQIEDPLELASAVRTVLKDSKTFRPEIVSRFDHVYVFKPLDDETQARIGITQVVAFDLVEQLLHLSRIAEQTRHDDTGLVLGRNLLFECQFGEDPKGEHSRDRSVKNRERHHRSRQKPQDHAERPEGR